MGARTSGGYGRFGTGYAHRYALELKLGRALGRYEQALHDPKRCNNPPCCNPVHLRSGTVSDNADDRQVSGTQSHTPIPGAANGAAKLSEAAIEEITRRYKAATARGSKGRLFDELARKYGVTRRAIEYAAHGATWASSGRAR